MNPNRDIRGHFIALVFGVTIDYIPIIDKHHLVNGSLDLFPSAPSNLIDQHRCFESLINSCISGNYSLTNPLVIVVQNTLFKQMSFSSTPSFKLASNDHLLLLGCTGLFGRHLLPRLKAFSDHNTDLPKVTLLTRSRTRTLQTYPYLSGFNVIEIDFSQTCNLHLDQSPLIFCISNTSAYDTYHGTSQYSKYHLLVNSIEALRGVVKPGITKILFTSSGVAYGSTDTFSETILHINILILLFHFALPSLLLNIFSTLCSEGASLSICRCFSLLVLSP